MAVEEIEVPYSYPYDVLTTGQDVDVLTLPPKFTFYIDQIIVTNNSASPATVTIKQKYTGANNTAATKTLLVVKVDAGTTKVFGNLNLRITTGTIVVNSSEAVFILFSGRLKRE